MTEIIHREKLDVAVIGGGVIGLAIAREFALQGREVTLFEKETRVGTETSSRNSEVIHSGMYYTADSLKAKLCIDGRRQLYEYCQEKGVPYKKIGKMVVATRNEELTILEGLKKQGDANGVEGLSWLNTSEARELEPSILCEGALFSAETGIVDSHQLMKTLQRDAESAGAMMLLSSPILKGSVEENGIALSVGGRNPVELLCNTVINSSGLHAHTLARQIEGFPHDKIPDIYYAKGHYFMLSQKSPFTHLVYSVPEPGGLGIHITLDLAGNARFGPDVSWINSVNYDFDPSRKEAFSTAIRKYFSDLKNSSLQPGYTGVRPKLGPANSPEQDFVIQGSKEHGIPGITNLFGIESPGLTACLAIAKYVTSL